MRSEKSIKFLISANENYLKNMKYLPNSEKLRIEQKISDLKWVLGND